MSLVWSIWTVSYEKAWYKWWRCCRKWLCWKWVINIWLLFDILKRKVNDTLKRLPRCARLFQRKYYESKLVQKVSWCDYLIVSILNLFQMSDSNCILIIWYGIITVFETYAASLVGFSNVFSIPTLICTENAQKNLPKPRYVLCDKLLRFKI